MNTLFTECYGDQKATDTTTNQSGCGYANIGSLALEPLMGEIKKGILNASQAVLRQLRKRQVGGGAKKKKKTQIGKGRKKKQVGKGIRKKSKKKNKH
jgi:hypothetical protein